jgi:Rrf2 family protein
MQLSKRAEYALRALIDIEIARQAGREHIRAQEISEHEAIPIPFLEQILAQLRAAGLVTAKRGKAGGYTLARPADTIIMGAVLRLIEGSLAPISCVSLSSYKRCTCPDEDHCGLRMLMLDTRNAIAGVLDRYSLAEIVDVTIRKLRRDHLPIPFAREKGFSSD